MGTRDLWTWWRRGRRALLVAAAVWCVVLGFGVTASFVDHGVLGQTGTLTLLGALGMLVLPGLTAIALRFDSRERVRAHVSRNDRDGVVTTHNHPRLALREAPDHRVRTATGRSTADRAEVRQSA